MTSDAGLDEWRRGRYRPSDRGRPRLRVSRTAGHFWTPDVHPTAKQTDRRLGSGVPILPGPQQGRRQLVVYQGSSCFVLMNLFRTTPATCSCAPTGVSDYTELTVRAQGAGRAHGHHHACVDRSLLGEFNLGMNQGGRRRRNRRASAPARCSSGGRRELPP